MKQRKPPFGKQPAEPDDDRPMYDLAMSAIQKREKKIERLEAELADLRAERGDVEALRAAVVDLHRQLAGWQRHGVKITEDCEGCGGVGETVGPMPIGRESCRDCGGTEKKPRDGVLRRSSVYQHMIGPRDFLDEIDVPESGDYIVFPADWLEATDE